MGKKIDFGTDEEFINKYKELKSSRKMGSYYGCDKKTIIHHCKEIGFDYNSVQEYKLTENDKQEILDSYDLYTSTELSKKYNVSRGMITKLWWDNNLKEKKITRNKGDLTGLTFTRLTVLRKTEIKDASQCYLYDCLCECGNHILANPISLKNGKIKSCGCLSKEILIKNRKDNFIDITNTKWGELTVIKRVENSNTYHNSRWLCKCSCGRNTIISISNLKKPSRVYCGFCNNVYKGNEKIESLLLENNISFVREKRFDTLRDKLPLAFDFYVDNKYVIEYDGEQHFDDTHFFYSDKMYKHDKMKNKWCMENNIPIIRIPYTHYNSLTINDLLLETSKFILPQSTLDVETVLSETERGNGGFGSTGTR